MSRLKRRMSKNAAPTIVFLMLLMIVPLAYAIASDPAPAGFDDTTNGFTGQTRFDTDRAQFDAVEEIPDGLGPVSAARPATLRASRPSRPGPPSMAASSS